MKGLPLVISLALLVWSTTPLVVCAQDLAAEPIQEAVLYQEAESLWRSILQTDPRNPVAHYNLGIALGNQGKWAEAIAAYQQALKLDPQFKTAYLNLGHALTMLKQLSEAGAAYEQVLKLDPTFVLAQQRLQALQRLNSDDQGRVASEL